VYVQHSSHVSRWTASLSISRQHVHDNLLAWSRIWRFYMLLEDRIRAQVRPKSLLNQTLLHRRRPRAATTSGMVVRQTWTVARSAPTRSVTPQKCAMMEQIAPVEFALEGCVR
jgi:hypothetical protein